MVEFSKGAGLVVANDARTAVAAFDGALLSGARMCVSVLEAAQGANIPAARTQKVLRSISSSLSAVVEGRGEIVAAVRDLNAIKLRSNLRVEDYGCPDGWEAVDPTAAPTGADAAAVAA